VQLENSKFVLFARSDLVVTQPYDAIPLLLSLSSCILLSIFNPSSDFETTKKPLFLNKERPLKFLVETGESRTPRPEERSSESLQAYTAVCSRLTVIRRPISVEPVDVS
jgi:hypothetical protein